MLLEFYARMRVHFLVKGCDTQMYKSGGRLCWRATNSHRDTSARCGRFDMEVGMKKGLRIGILTIAAAALAVSCFQLYRIFSDYRSGAEEYEELREYVQGDTEMLEDGFPVSEIYFSALSEINSDFCAWLYVPALQLSYPVVWCGDNETYLTRTFEGNRNSAGCLFVDGQNQSDFTDRHTIIYGHNMKNGTMFGSLSDLEQSEDLAEREPWLYLYTENDTICYLIVSYYTTTWDSDTYRYISTDGQYDAYMDMIRENSLYDGFMKAEWKEGERPDILTLSTCHGRAGGKERFVVHAVRWEREWQE